MSDYLLRKHLEHDTIFVGAYTPSGIVANIIRWLKETTAWYWDR